VEDAASPGVISGRIALRANVAAPAPVVPDHDVTCCVKPLTDETLRRAPSGGVADAVVYLTGIEAGKAWPAETPTLNNAQCRFDPHILVVRAGSPITVKNTDGCVHNVNTFARRNPPTNATLPPPAAGGRAVTRTFAVPEEIKVVCDSHKWMSAWIVVSDADGRFLITDVPPGRHRATVWHERLGRFEAEVEVPPVGEARLDHTFDTVQP
jgi:plastocyanin